MKMKNQKNKVETIVVASTVLKQADYDKSTGLLSLTFNNNKKYNYVNVPEEIWKNFKVAPSKGKFFTQFIKNNFKDPNFNHMSKEVCLLQVADEFVSMQ